MADKLISDLNAVASVVADDLFEVQKSTENVTKKATLTQVTAVEAAARAAQDDVIEAGCGLNANGTYTPEADSWWMRVADFAAGTDDRAGATGALTANIQNALRLLDGKLYEVYAMVAGISGEVATFQVKLSSGESRLLWNAGAGYTLIPDPDPTPSSDWFYHLIAAVSWIDFATAAMDYGADTLDMFYDGTPGTTICSWTNAFLESAADSIMQGTFIDNYAIQKNQSIKVRSSSQDDATGTFTGNVYIAGIYKLYYLDEGIPPDD